MIRRFTVIACVLALTPIAARAQEAQPPERLFLLGAGVYATTNPYATAKKKTQTGVLPLFVYQTQRLTADLSGLAVTAWSNDHIKLEGRVAPRFQLVDPKDTRDFAFLKRDTGVDLGGRISGMAGPATLSVEYLRDVASETRGQEINLDLTLSASPLEKLSVDVVAGVSWKDEKLATWLYGLSEKEAGKVRAFEYGRTARAASGGVLVPSLGVQARYQVTDRLFVIAAAEVELFDNDITDSPLMAKDHTAAGFVSLVRRF
jgi:outer membrane scaffolding protein for murein synthesis (MipA/OmpV family)